METSTEQNMEDAILSTAEKLFLEKGFAATSTVMIAKEVGCNQALIHYYYRTKDNLFNKIFETKFRVFFQSIFDTTNLANLSFQEKIVYITSTHFDLLLRNPKIPNLILNDLTNRPQNIQILKENLHTLPEQLFSIMNKDLQEEINAGRVRKLDFFDIAMTIISLNLSLFIMMPFGKRILEISDDKMKELLQHRKEENIKLIISYLRP